MAGDGLRSRLTEKLGESERKALQQIWMSLDTRQREVRKLEADPARRTRAEEAGARLGQEIALAFREKLPGERALTARQAVERVLDAIADFSDL